ncbi:MAG: hypothetical protein M1838_001301 [Thelocarpon superellum]|nr:MAG: hypothetical protein M1838_001301 [Thelocarpon superellum]
MNDPQVNKMIRWLLDTRQLWREGDFVTEAQPHLNLLPQAEQDAILRYRFLRDRCMALGSKLVKRLAISHLSGESFREIRIGEDSHRKPIHIPRSPGGPAVSFNVSHQAGLVVLVALCPREKSPASVGVGVGIGIGIDIVCVSERDDAQQMTEQGGFDAWISTYAEIFSEKELTELKSTLAPPLNEVKLELHPRLRRFYAFWALKEAYIKMTGEALLAPWLRHLEFGAVRVPVPVPVPAMVQGPTSDGVGSDGTPSSDEATNEHVFGDCTRSMEIWLHGRRVHDVRIELVALGPDFMVATAISAPAHARQEGDMDEDSFPVFDLITLSSFDDLLG